MARVEIAVKTARFGLFRQIHPHAVNPVTFNKKTLRSEQLIRANLYIVLFVTVYLFGALLLSLDARSESVYDALNYSQAMITNAGVTIADLGSPGLASMFSPFSKVVMSLEMIAGRLEIYPLLMLFAPGFWKSNSEI